jgi:23S rRNA (pseudouridine1915-N3)-methyltransferase
MYRLTVICVGKLKERHWREAQDEYLKRLATNAKSEVVELEPEPLGATVTPALSMRAEGQKILKRLPKDAFVVVMDKGGRPLDSVKFAEFFREQGDGGRHLVFIIGGAAGIDPAVMEEADAKLSLSAMTFTHEMARIFLLEQIYRAMTIISGKAYHY